MEKRSLIEEKNESSVNGGEKQDQNQPILEEKLPITVDPVSDRELIYTKTLELCRSHSNLEDGVSFDFLFDSLKEKNMALTPSVVR